MIFVKRKKLLKIDFYNKENLNCNNLFSIFFHEDEYLSFILLIVKVNIKSHHKININNHE